MGYGVAMDGADAVASALDYLGRVRTRKVLRTSLRREAKNAAEKAESKINHKTGQMAKRLKVRAGKRDENAVSMVVLGEGPEVAHLELGHKLGPKDRGNNRAQVEPFPFMRPGFDETVNDAARRIAEDLDQAIADTLAKGNQ